MINFKLFQVFRFPSLQFVPTARLPEQKAIIAQVRKIQFDNEIKMRAETEGFQEILAESSGSAASAEAKINKRFERQIALLQSKFEESAK